MKLFNILGFQAIWWTTIYYRNGVLPLAVLFVGLHFYLQNKEDRFAELCFVLAVASIGLIVDTALINVGVMNFVGQSEIGLQRLPLWMLAIWVGFAMTLRHSLAWLFNRRWLLLGVGGVGAAGSYIAAGALGALSFQISSSQAWVFMTVLWMILFLLFEYLFRLSQFKSSVVQTETP